MWDRMELQNIRAVCCRAILKLVESVFEEKESKDSSAPAALLLGWDRVCRKGDSCSANRKRACITTNSCAATAIGVSIPSSQLIGHTDKVRRSANKMICSHNHLRLQDLHRMILTHFHERRVAPTTPSQVEREREKKEIMQSIW